MELKVFIKKLISSSPSLSEKSHQKSPYLSEKGEFLSFSLFNERKKFSE